MQQSYAPQHLYIYPSQLNFAKRKKHILIEKPLDANLKKFKEINEFNKKE